MTEATASTGTTDVEDAEAPLPPGPDGLPVLGSTLSVVRDPMGFVDDLAGYGDVVRYRVGGLPFTALLHPDHVERVLVSESERFRRWSAEEWPAFADFAPEGLLLTEGDAWRQQRLLIQPAFTPDRIRGYADAMVRYADETVSGWDDGEVVPVNRETSRLALRILAKSLFDIDVEGRDEVVRRTAAALSRSVDSRSIGTFLPDWVPTPAARRSRRAREDVRALVDDLIAERRDEEGAYDDLLAILLSAEAEDGRTLSPDEVRDNMITFLFAGHETTSLALSYALFLLSRHPEKRAKLEEEVEAVLGDDPPTPATVPDLDYTERVVKEALRLYPPVYVLFREATEDATVGGFRIPEGTKLNLPLFHIHGDGRFYDEPGRFRPERWTDEMEAALPEYAYFPFGGGPRHCIGMRFAMMELKHVLPTVVRQVDLELASDPDIDFQMGVTLQPAEDIEMRVRRR